MSIKLMIRVWWRPDVRTMEKFVALALADIAHNDGSCYPSVERLAKMCSCTVRTVQIALRDLEKKGLLKRRRRKDRTDHYQLVLENWPLVEEPANSPKEREFTRAEYEYKRAWDSEYDAPMDDLFDPKPTGEDNSPVEKEDGRSKSHRPPKISTSTPEADSPKPLEEPLEEPLEKKGPENSDPATSVVISLRDFIQTEWDKLKADFPNMGSCRKVLDSQLELARDRARQHALAGQSDIDVWAEVFALVRKSRFQTGRVAPTNGRNRYKLTLSELLKTHIFRETMNGKYTSDDADEGGYDPHTGEILGPARAATRSTIERLRSARKRGERGDDSGGAG